MTGEKDSERGSGADQISSYLVAASVGWEIVKRRTLETKQKSSGAGKFPAPSGLRLSMLGVWPSCSPTLKDEWRTDI